MATRSNRCALSWNRWFTPTSSTHRTSGKYLDDRNEPVFKFYSLDEYCQLIQLIGLCFLLHRRDLLPRLVFLQDGVSAIGQVGQGNGGTDWLYEEFMSAGLGADTRYEADTLSFGNPYSGLADAMSSSDNVVDRRTCTGI